MAPVVTLVPFRSAADYATALPRVLEHLWRGGAVAHPTETIYGIGSTLEPSAVARVASLKGRARNKPFVVLVNGLAMLGTLQLPLSASAKRLADRFWPGALTLVLPTASRALPAEVRGSSGVAVRWTSHTGMQTIIQALGEPITSTSANVSGLPPARSAAEIASQWTAETASGDLLVLDGGTLDDLTPSTIVDCSAPTPRVIRRGAIAASALREIVPALIEW